MKDEFKFCVDCASSVWKEKPRPEFYCELNSLGKDLVTGNDIFTTCAEERKNNMNNGCGINARHYQRSTGK